MVRKPTVKSLAEVARAGERRRTLEALRDRLAADIDVAPPTVTAQLAGKLQDVLRELDELPVEREVSAVDEIASRRASRRATAQSGGPAAKRNV